jgi:hypothetical protein
MKREQFQTNSAHPDYTYGVRFAIMVNVGASDPVSRLLRRNAFNGPHAGGILCLSDFVSQGLSAPTVGFADSNWRQINSDQYCNN